MATPVLYVANTDLTLRNISASWAWPTGRYAPLDPANTFTIRLLTAGYIAVAPDDAHDDTTPAHILDGVPGLKTAVSN